MTDVAPVTVAVERPRLRWPRTIILINGEEMTGWEDWETEENSFYQADTFRIAFAEGDLPAGRGAGWWSTQTEFLVEILTGNVADPLNFTKQDLESVFYGKADDLDWNPVARVMELHGRDLTGELLDTKTSEKYPMLTASKIVETVAKKYGLTPKVTATKTRVGKYYGADKVRMQSEQTEWELLTWLAREEGFNVFIRGQELHFEPPPADKDPYVIEWEPPTETTTAAANAVTLRFSRALTVSKSIKVTVKSWNAKQKKAFTKTSTRGKADTGGKPQEYSYTIPGLDADAAQKRADQIAAELSAHEMKVTVQGPANNNFHIDRQLEIRGTQTAFDQLYFPDSISRAQDVDAGLAWTITAKNHSPESDPSL